jgi:hypothetical protein
MTQDALDAKRASLEDLEAHEREAARLAQALDRGRILPTGAGSSSEPGPAGGSEGEGDGEGEGAEDAPRAMSASLPPHPGPNPVKRRAPGMGLLNALSYTLHGMIDADPEAARRASISKTRENISHVCSASSTREREIVQELIAVDVIARGCATPICSGFKVR